MRCSDAKRLCCGHLDRELTRAEVEAFQAHLRDCPECAAQVEQLEECVELLRGLPEIDPGRGFLECVQEKIRAAEAGERPLPADERSWSQRVREWAGALTLRPAMAAGVWLLCGILLGGGVARLAWNTPGDSPGAASNLVDAAPQALPRGGGEAAGLGVQSPFRDLDLEHLVAATDTNRFEPEYLLEPYVQDPQRGLVPASMDYLREVTGDRDAQNDVYTVF